MLELIEWTQREILELIEWTQREIIELIQINTKREITEDESEDNE